MRIYLVAVCLVLNLILVSCGSDDSPGPGDLSVSVTCADIHNGDVSPVCASLPVAALSKIVVDSGDVSRSTLITTTIEVTNPTENGITGFMKVIMDAGCNGATSWEIMSMQQYKVAANETLTVSVGGMCGDMPLGNHTATGTVWEADGVTVIDEVIVDFNLIE